MQNRIMSPRFCLIAAVLAGVSLSSVTSTRAGIRQTVTQVITVQRVVGLAFLGGSAALAARGFDFRDEADEFYDRYQAATDPIEIEHLYQRTTNKDVKSQVSWALAGAFAISGARLLLTGDRGGDRLTERSVLHKRTTQKHSESNRLSILPRLRRRPGVGIELRKPFF